MAQTRKFDDGAKQKRRHWSRFIFPIVVACCLIVMNLRGTIDHRAMDDLSRYTAPAGPGMGIVSQPCAYQHGWPFEWAASESRSKFKPSYLLNGSSVHVRHPTYFDGWLYDAKLDSISYVGIVANMFVAIALIAIVFFASQIKFRRHGRFGFALRDVVIVLTLISCFLGWYRYHADICKTENHAVSYLFPGKTEDFYSRRWRGPRWLRCIAGSSGWLDVFNHVDEVLLPHDHWKSEQHHIHNLPYLREINISGAPVSDEFLASLAECKSLEKVLLSASFEQQVASQHTVPLFYPTVRELTLDFNLQTWKRSLEFLRCCPNVEQLTIHGGFFLLNDLDGIELGKLQSFTCKSFLTERGHQQLKQNFPFTEVNYTKPDYGFYAGEWLIEADRNYVSDWEELTALLKRLREDDRDRGFGLGTLDLIGIDVDSELVDRLAPFYPLVEALVFGKQNSPESVIELGQKCTNVDSFFARNVDLSFQQIMDLPESIVTLYVEKADITEDQFKLIIAKLKLAKLVVFLSKEESLSVSDIRSADEPCDVVISRGFVSRKTIRKMMRNQQ